MVERIHLDVVERETEKIWFTLVIDEPIRYYVEQHHEPFSISFSTLTRTIPPEELSKIWVNDQPLIKLVEKAFHDQAMRHTQAA